MSIPPCGSKRQPSRAGRQEKYAADGPAPARTQFASHGLDWRSGQSQRPGATQIRGDDGSTGSGQGFVSGGRFADIAVHVNVILPSAFKLFVTVPPGTS